MTVIPSPFCETVRTEARNTGARTRVCPVSDFIYWLFRHVVTKLEGACSTGHWEQEMSNKLHSLFPHGYRVTR